MGKKKTLALVRGQKNGRAPRTKRSHLFNIDFESLLNCRPACQTRPGIEPGTSPKREPRRDENSNRLTGRRRIMKIFRIRRQQKKCRPIQSDTMYRPAAHIQDDELYLPAGQLGMGWWGDAKREALCENTDTLVTKQVTSQIPFFKTTLTCNCGKT